MSLFRVLNVGATGLQAHQFGVSLSGENATNAATEGYSRRRAELQPLASPLLGGARAVSAGRVIDSLVEKRLLGARAQMGFQSARVEVGRTVDNIFADVDGGIAARTDAFQKALNDFATYPDDRATRDAVLYSARDLALGFNDAAAALESARAEANSKMTSGVAEVNARLQEIADIGKQIARHESPFGEEASDLRDRRDQLIREISDFVPVKFIEQSDGTASVLLASSLSLVSPDGTVTELVASVNATTGNVQVERVSAGALEDVTSLLTSGRIAGHANARDGLVAKTQAQLDQLAFDFATAYNAVHQAGFGLDGATGRNLFEPIAAAAGAARALTVSTDVAGSPDRLAGALDAASLPGDDRGALALLAVADQTVASGGTETFKHAFGSMLGSVGGEVRSMLNDADYATTVRDQTQAVREGVSGVSTDEEMISLTKFQRAYEASLQVVRTADELLGELMALKR